MTATLTNLATTLPLPVSETISVFLAATDGPVQEPRFFAWLTALAQAYRTLTPMHPIEGLDALLKALGEAPAPSTPADLLPDAQTAYDTIDEHAFEYLARFDDEGNTTLLCNLETEAATCAILLRYGVALPPDTSFDTALIPANDVRGSLERIAHTVHTLLLVIDKPWDPDNEMAELKALFA